MKRSSMVKGLLGLVACAAATLLPACSTGPNTPPGQDPNVWQKNIFDYLNLRNSFLDPSQVGRFDKANPWGIAKPVQWPILEQLDALDEPDPHWIGATDPLPGDLVVEQTEYVVGEGDFLNISVYELVLPGVQYTDQRQVNEVGNITVQNLGQIHVSGLTPSQVEEKIGQLAVERGFLQPKSATNPGPQVSVQLAQSRARVFSALGQVGQSGTYNIIGNDFRMLDALALARDVIGGSQPGMDYLYVIRPQKGAGVVQPPGAKQPSTMPDAAPTTSPLNTLDNLRPSSDATPLPATRPAQASRADDKPAFLRTIPKEMLTVDQPAGQAGLDAAISGNPGAPAATPTTAPATAAATIAGPSQTQMNPVTGTHPGMIYIDGKWQELTPAAQPAGTLTQDQAIAAAQSLSGVRVIRIPIDKLKEGDPRYNIVIRPGDWINVPNIVPGEFYVYGHVNRPGVYSLTGRKITLKMAFAAAGGLDSLAVPRKCDLVRRVGGTEVTVQVDLQRIFDGEAPDIYLKANDWVNVGTDAVAPFLAVTRNAYRASYGFGLVYDRDLYIQPGSVPTNPTSIR